MDELIKLCVAAYFLSKGVKDLFRPITDMDLLKPKYIGLGRLLLTSVLIWSFFGCPWPTWFKAKENPRLDSSRWHHAHKTDTPYKWWQYGPEMTDTETIMPVAACTHYDRAPNLQREVLSLPSEPTQRELMELSPQAAKDKQARYAMVMNSSMDAQDQCFMSVRTEHLHLETRMRHLTTDPMAPSILDFVAQSSNRDLLAAPSDGRVNDILVSRLGEVFARVVAITKQATKDKHEAYTLALARVQLSLNGLLSMVQRWYDDQVGKMVVVDTCNGPAQWGIFRSGLYFFFNNVTHKFDLLAKMHISNPNLNSQDYIRVKEMPFVDYLNPHPALVHRRLPVSLMGNFTYPEKFEISYYNLSQLMTNYQHLYQKVNRMIPGVHWLPFNPNVTESVDHVPLLIAPLEKMAYETRQWVQEDEITRCIIYCDRLEVALLAAATGGEGKEYL